MHDVAVFRAVTDRVTFLFLSLILISNFEPCSYPFDRIKRLYDINVHGAFFTAREAARHMIPNGGGAITLVASMSANVRSLPRLCAPRTGHRMLTPRAFIADHQHPAGARPATAVCLSELIAVPSFSQPQTPYNASKAGELSG